MALLPPGARAVQESIQPELEEELLAQVDASSWRPDLKRRVQHYGWRYDYRARSVTEDMALGALPDWLAQLAETVGVAFGFKRKPDQVIVNEYLPGQGISAHVDCEPCFGPTIASLSLGGPAAMTFEHRKNGERRSLILQPRMLLILSGKARYDWTHGIPARKSDVINGGRRARTRRVSLTFRTVTI